MTQTTPLAGSGKPLRRLPRPRLLSLVLGVAGVVVIVAGVFLHGSTPVVNPTPPVGYGPAPSTSLLSPVPMPGHLAGSPDGGLLPDASFPPAGASPPEGEPAPVVPVSSGALADLEPPRVVKPVRLVIPALGIDAPIQAVGVRDGEMEVPPTAGVVAWYRFGPAPGRPGSAVLAAHVSWGGELGVFYSLRDLPQGAEIEVRFADGSTRRFRSAALAAYDKTDLPVERVFRRDGDPVLTLVTCGGYFNPSLRHFTQNIVAYALPIEAPDDPAGGGLSRPSGGGSPS